MYVSVFVFACVWSEIILWIQRTRCGHTDAHDGAMKEIIAEKICQLSKINLVFFSLLITFIRMTYKTIIAVDSVSVYIFTVSNNIEHLFHTVNYSKLMLIYIRIVSSEL